VGVILQERVQEFFLRGLHAPTTTEQGRALEDLVCYLFEAIPGIGLTERNLVNPFGTEEIDVAFWNDQLRLGLWFLPTTILVECKNWSKPVGSDEVSYFVRKLQNRRLDFGLLVATRGITGSPSLLTDAHFEVATALKDGVRVVVIDRAEIETLLHSDHLIELVKRKLLMLATRGTCF
jgi:hypothetical protein